MQNEPISIIAQQYPKVVIPLIDSAVNNIRVVVFDWRFYPTISASPVSLFNAAIGAAAKRGVQVRALVNNDLIVQKLRAFGCEARRLNSTKMLHTKMILVDDVALVIGSHNFTQHAFSMNEEASVLVRLSDPQNDFVKYFEALWGV